MAELIPFLVKGRVKEAEDRLRASYLAVIEEMTDSLSHAFRDQSRQHEHIKSLQTDNAKLKAAVMNFERIVSARDRFGCWLCSRHEREGDMELNQDEMESLRSENVQLRSEIKRLERSIRAGNSSGAVSDSTPIATTAELPFKSALRSSFRTSTGEPKPSSQSEQPRQIQFSRQSISGDGKVSKRYALGGRESPSSAHRSPSLRDSSDEGSVNRRVSVSFDAAEPVPEGRRRARSKQSLFGMSSDSGANPAWALKYTADDNGMDQADISALTDVMSSIGVCRSVCAASSDLAQVAGEMTLIRVGAGDTVCRQGEVCLFFMVIKQGDFLRESTTAESRDLRPHDFLGEAIFIHPAPFATASVTCTSPTGGSLWVIHRDALRAVLKKSSIKQFQLVKHALNACPKILRDSVNAAQFSAICKSATLFLVEEEGVVQPLPGSGLTVVAQEGTVIVDQGSAPIGTLVLPSCTGARLRAGCVSRFVSLGQREIDSIPPLRVALTALIKSVDIPPTQDCLYIPQNPPAGSESPYRQQTSRLFLSNLLEDPSESAESRTNTHPLSPSLRPSLSQSDTAHIALFGLLSISTKTHLVNRAKFASVPYTDPPTSQEFPSVGLLLVLNGIATITHQDGTRVVLEQGQACGLGQGGNCAIGGTVVVEPDSRFAEIDGSVDSLIQPPVVVAWWAEADLRAALPLAVSQSSDEQSILSYLRKRKLLLRNPIFQFLPESGVEQVIALSHTVVLNHNDRVSSTVSGDQSVLVLDGSVLATQTGDEGTTKLSSGDFFNADALLSSNGGAHTTMELKCYTSMHSEILVIEKSVFDAACTRCGEQDGGSSQLQARIQQYLKSIHDRIEPGDIKIGRMIGRGGTATVKMATIPKERPAGTPAEELPTYALKVIQKRLLEKHKKLSLLKNERFILQQLDNSEFIIKLKTTFKDSRCIYFLLELAPGGDFLSLLNQSGLMSRAHAQFYLGCMVLALQYCHGHGVVYRDLKSENLLVDARGYLKLADFGIAKQVPKGHVTYSLVGTPQFMAPEVILGKGYGASADVWGLGCCLFEMVAGELPLTAMEDEDSPSQFELFQRIVHFRPDLLKFPQTTEGSTAELVRLLMEPDPHSRIGCSVGTGVEEVMTHPFFDPAGSTTSAPFSWSSLESRTLTPPMVPPPLRPSQPLTSHPTGSSDTMSEAGGVPTASPALSAVSWASFDLGGGDRTTTISWDLE